MLAINEPKRSYIDVPKHIEQKRISTEINKLCARYEREHQAPFPISQWIVEQLVLNGIKQCIIEEKDVAKRIRLTLKEIIVDTVYDDCQYINYRNFTPLFPNVERLTPRQTHWAMKQLLDYTEKKH